MSPDNLVFFRRCDVERVLGTSLEDLRRLQARRVEAAHVLTAAVMRLKHARVFAHTAPRCWGLAVETLRCLQLTRLVQPAAPHREWIPGGPYYRSEIRSGGMYRVRGLSEQEAQAAHRAAAQGSCYAGA